MTQKKDTEMKIRKSRRSRRTIAVFWICLILVVAPIAVLGWMLLSSAMDTHKPVFGNRYEGDLDPAITQAQIETIDAAVASIEGVEAEFSNMATATLRIYAKVAGTATGEQATAVAQNIYSAVSATLDPNVYFMQADGRKMYDLEIHVYNMSAEEDRSSDAFVYVIGTKTSNMTDPEYQTVSEARYPELAQQLRDDVAAREAAEAAAEASPAADAGAEGDASAEQTEG